MLVVASLASRLFPPAPACAAQHREDMHRRLGLRDAERPEGTPPLMPGEVACCEASAGNRAAAVAARPESTYLASFYIAVDDPLLGPGRHRWPTAGVAEPVPRGAKPGIAGI